MLLKQDFGELKSYFIYTYNILEQVSYSSSSILLQEYTMVLRVISKFGPNFFFSVLISFIYNKCSSCWMGLLENSSSEGLLEAQSMLLLLCFPKGLRLCDRPLGGTVFQLWDCHLRWRRYCRDLSLPG